ncbi:C6 zinc finger domain [Cordyceps militaris]|uniref:C6 zinc finger domain n=1 Tax=Cordyceps militaris TaxID=73501 RepID=A0A2H4SC13_CORMI|nr:C6 zinc finger domain [Cordyceps militaris]
MASSSRARPILRTDYFGQQLATKIDRDATVVATNSLALPKPLAAPDSPLAQPAFETKERRLLELQLMNYFCFDVCSSLPGTYFPETRNIWTVVVPRLATNYDALLNAIMTLALRHMLCSGCQDIAPLDEKYQSVVGTLSPAVADAASFTSVVLSLDAFASLRDRDIGDYAAPVQWLHLCKGVMQVFRVTLKLLKGYPEANINKIVATSGPFVERSQIMCEANRNQFPALLMRQPGESNEDDAAYIETVSYIGAIQSAIKAGEDIHSTTRRLIVYPVLFPQRFVELLDEHRPRALVILAHFFAVAAHCRTSAWVGDIPKREIIALAGFLAPQYQHELAWPLITTAQMAIYAAMIIPVLYLLFRHGKVGIIGWFYLAAFCVLRILGGALALGGSKTATIIANIGLSPLLLAASGILHESNSLRKVGDAKVEWAVVLALHILVAGATAILAVGASALQSSSPLPSDLIKVKVGITLLLIGWVVLVGWSLQSWFRRSTQHSEASRAGRKILIGVAFALLFIGIRVVYTLVAFFSQKQSLSPVTGTLVVRIMLVLVPELVASLILIAYGWITRNDTSPKNIEGQAARIHTRSRQGNA